MTGLPESVDEARRIFAMANKDLTALEGMGDPVVFSEEIFGFHAEQATEKLLKSWLASLSIEYPNTHDLGRLFRMLEDQGQAVTAHTRLADFTPFGVQFRYEAYGESNDPPIDRAQAVQDIRGLVTQVRTLF